MTHGNPHTELERPEQRMSLFFLTVVVGESDIKPILLYRHILSV